MKVLANTPRIGKYVFSTERGHLTSHASSYIVRVLRETVGFPKEFTFHYFRHYHATQLIKKGVNVKVVSRRLGHKDIVTTLNLYFNYMPSMDEDASVMTDDVIE